MIAGGFDHISEEDFYKFANMKARLSDKQRWNWICYELTEMSRPATTSHAGLVYGISSM